jgi:AcrR family transcriptional regulator
MSAGYASDAGGQLPRGRHGLTHGAVVEHQRQRLIRAVPAAVRAKGYLALTVEDICAGAGVSRRTFYENFRDKEDCFLSSYRQHAQELLAAVGGAASVGGDWQERVRLGLAALLRHLTERPDLAHMGVIDMKAAGLPALAERDRTIMSLASLIGDDAVTIVSHPAPRLLWRTTAGAIAQLIYGYVLEQRTAELEELLPTIMYLVLVAVEGRTRAAARAGLLTDGPTS